MIKSEISSCLQTYANGFHSKLSSKSCIQNQLNTFVKIQIQQRSKKKDRQTDRQIHTDYIYESNFFNIQPNTLFSYSLRISPFPEQALFFMCLQYKSLENTVGKGEIARNEQLLLFPQCFLPN